MALDLAIHRIPPSRAKNGIEIPASRPGHPRHQNAAGTPNSAVLRTAPQNDENGGGYSTRPATPVKVPGTNSKAIHDSPPPNGEDNGLANAAENPNRG